MLYKNFLQILRYRQFRYLPFQDPDLCASTPAGAEDREFPLQKPIFLDFYADILMNGSCTGDDQGVMLHESAHVEYKTGLEEIPYKWENAYHKEFGLQKTITR